MDEQVTLYEAAGGMSFFEALVDRFYDGVGGRRGPPAPLPEDLTPSRRHLALFLAQCWGGPSTYDDERGQPRLRMRHIPFEIGPRERDRWLSHMRQAVAELDPRQEVAEALLGYFSMSAEALRKRS